ncbi:MAG: hypothetical protein HZB83_02770, partial [Deltaproteobacteria bacterium]|nr:hypothetical protein [Deltaproteobacteria bacterium]
VPRAEGQFVCIMEGDQQRVKEIAACIQSAGIDCKVLNAGRGSSCSSGVFGIFVQQSLAREAAMTVDKVKGKLYPGLFEAEERLSAGLCPACGADISNSPSSDECPDCGLNLSGRGPGGCGDGCGPC